MWKVKIFSQAPRITKTVRPRKCGSSKYSHMHQESEKLICREKLSRVQLVLKFYRISEPYYLSVPLFSPMTYPSTLWPVHQSYDLCITVMTYRPIYQPFWTFPMTSITLLTINQPFDLSITTLTCPSLIMTYPSPLWPIHQPLGLSL